MRKFELNFLISGRNLSETGGNVKLSAQMCLFLIDFINSRPNLNGTSFDFIYSIGIIICLFVFCSCFTQAQVLK